MKGKEWDEDRLRRWEWKCNGGKDWEGRPKAAEPNNSDAPADA